MGVAPGGKAFGWMLNIVERLTIWHELLDGLCDGDALKAAADGSYLSVQQRQQDLGSGRREQYPEASLQFAVSQFQDEFLQY